MGVGGEGRGEGGQGDGGRGGVDSGTFILELINMMEEDSGWEREHSGHKNQGDTS